MAVQGISLFSVLPLLPPSFTQYYSLLVLSGKIREVLTNRVYAERFTSDAGEDKCLACRKINVLLCLHPFDSDSSLCLLSVVV